MWVGEQSVCVSQKTQLVDSVLSEAEGVKDKP